MGNFLWSVHLTANWYIDSDFLCLFFSKVKARNSSLCLLCTRCYIDIVKSTEMKKIFPLWEEKEEKFVATGTWLYARYYVPGFRSIILLQQSHEARVLFHSLDEKTEAQTGHWFELYLAGLWSLNTLWPHNPSLDQCPKIIFSVHRPQNGAEDREHKRVIGPFACLCIPGICLHRGWTESQNFLSLFICPSLGNMTYFLRKCSFLSSEKQSLLPTALCLNFP